MAWNKYGAQKVTYDGIRWDSRKECNRYCELKMLEKAGQISDLKWHVRYNLIPVQKDEKGKMIEKACDYVADFVYTDKTGKTVVEDVKGYRSSSSAGYAKFVIKRKLMLHLYGIRVVEV